MRMGDGGEGRPHLGPSPTWWGGGPSPCSPRMSSPPPLSANERGVRTVRNAPPLHTKTVWTCAQHHWTPCEHDTHRAQPGCPSTPGLRPTPAPTRHREESISEVAQHVRGSAAFESYVPGSCTTGLREGLRWRFGGGDLGVRLFLRVLLGLRWGVSWCIVE